MKPDYDTVVKDKTLEAHRDNYGGTDEQGMQENIHAEDGSGEFAKCMPDIAPSYCWVTWNKERVKSGQQVLGLQM